MSVRIFLSTVSDEFRFYRDQLRRDLTRPNVEVKLQEDFKDYGGVTLDKLDRYIASCDAVIHLVGDMTGADANFASAQVIRSKYPDLLPKLPPLRAALDEAVPISYTQWEAWLALHHGKALLIAKADDAAPRGPNYAPTDASRTAQQAHLVRLQEVGRYPGCTFNSPDNLAKYVFGSVILDLLAKEHSRDQQIDRNRSRLLEKVKKIWIDDYLEHSLHNIVRVELHLEETPGAVSSPWDLILQRPRQNSQPVPLGQPISAIFEDMGRTLLILGTPGSGKTTLLLELARDLLDRAEQDATLPTPVIFHLSSWAVRRAPLTDWLVDELDKRYSVPRKLAQAWIDRDQVLLLLDGLDEVAPEHRATCVEAINTFRRQHESVPLAVCCRLEDYEALPSRLTLSGAVVVKPLSRAQISSYLRGAGKQLAGVRAVLQDDETLWELVATPLMLSIVSLAYRGLSAGQVRAHGTLEQRRTHLFTTYIEAMFQRGRPDAKSEYTPEQTIRWLGWLARSLMKNHLSVFYLEWMQPDWLPSPPQQWIVTRGADAFVGVVSGMAWGLMMGIVFGVLHQHLLGWDDWLTWGLFGAGLGGVLGGVLGGSKLSVWLLGGTVFRKGLSPYPVDRIEPAEMLRWSWTKFRAMFTRTLGAALLFGSGFGTIFGLSFGMNYGLLYGLLSTLVWGLLFGVPTALVTDQITTRMVPNEGMRRSLRSALFSFLAYGTIGSLVAGLSAGVLVTMSTFVPSLDERSASLLNLKHGLIFALPFGMISGLPFALTKGGFAYIQHQFLRFILFCNNFAPWSYVRFLNYASERVLLYKVGGGYMFIHRFLLEYFAGLQPTHQTGRTKGT